jgi:hypothetical protein
LWQGIIPNTEEDVVDTGSRKTGSRRRREAETGDITRRLAALEQEIEEHQRWLREDPLLQRQARRAA